MNDHAETSLSTRLRGAYAAFLDAATTVAETPDVPDPSAGEWNADQIVAHVSILTATTLRAAAAVSSGEHTTYDNRISHDEWTLGHVLRAAGGSAALLERIRVQAEALCGYAPALGQADLETLLPTRLISHGAVLVDQPLALGVLLDGFADNEVPGHTAQLLALI
jgi:hypothetical protein